MPTALPEASISFPMLGDFSICPTTYFTLFGHRFYWYGLIFCKCVVFYIVVSSNQSAVRVTIYLIPHNRLTSQVTHNTPPFMKIVLPPTLQGISRFTSFLLQG